MLFNKLWDKSEQKPDVEHPFMSIDGFISWLGQQPGSKTYEYYSCQCAIGQYMEAHGKKYNEHWVMGNYYRRNQLRDWNLKITMQEPRTFGAAFERAKAYRDAGGK